MPYASTQLGRLFFQSLGTGNTVTFWPCLFGDSSVFRPCIHDLIDDHQVLLVDGPSHGRSDPLMRKFTLEQCADAWIEVLDQAGATQPATFCGLSWGSMVALYVALRHPHRVKSLFLMSTSALGAHPKRLPQFASLTGIIHTVGFKNWVIRLMESTMIAPQSLEKSPTLVRDMIEKNRHLNRRALGFAAASVLLRRSSFSHELWKVQAPTSVLFGDHDQVTPLRAAQSVALAIDGAKLETIENVGHLLPLEAPTQVRDLLRRALENETNQHPMPTTKTPS